ncbi:hypothetical protein BDV32DRAFT_129054 [Aspergillus pseudonomiae]|uniref:Uncharacterized protein n=1 Tax=Aspergillus pseudonomiae TaxID=1506151 RepID=A0A5N6HUT4_9EURO|nr:uncharacterized protein BDV37DRAFT_210796 [Aspergillus pseudonomiae]KAB8256463.1 hypothetical protein BDV32DRAFT_129054 [Aspergillus pseudonomiae]KAE8400304.1 hypothetical protein BDV37DRAFT_210796 [Aspergillus pseudonomiae]
MEMRSLARCLRSRPTSLLYKQQPGLLATQFMNRSAIRSYASKPSEPAKAQTPTATQAPSDFDEILSKLNINNRESAAEGSRNGPSEDPLALSRAVGMSAETENYRTPVRRVELKLGPTLGRQVHVEPEKGTDLASALRILQATCTANKIRYQANGQKFHTRRGQVRKNLKMDRWRKLFKFSFQKTVRRIEKMRAQGW